MIIIESQKDDYVFSYIRKEYDSNFYRSDLKFPINHNVIKSQKLENETLILFQ